MNTLRHDVQTHGFLVRSTALRRLGHSRREIADAVSDGWLTRPTRLWLATRDAQRDAVIAVVHRGRLTGASALGSWGLWRGLDRSIHILVPASSNGNVSRPRVPLSMFANPQPLTHGVIRHWGSGAGAAGGWRVSVVDALAAFARDADEQFFVAAVDNALYDKKLSPSELPLLFALLPQRLQPLRPIVDGRAESGTESVARLRCAGFARSIEIQVPVGRHRIDILLDGWLAVEIDSEQWHASTRVDDLRKSTWLTSQGYRVEHYDYQQVMHEWHAVELAIREILRIGPLR